MNRDRVISIISILYKSNNPMKLLDVLITLPDDFFPIDKLDTIDTDEAIHNAHEKEDFVMRDLLLMLNTQPGQPTIKYKDKVYTDPCTLEDIPKERIFKIREDDHIFIFDIWSLKKLIILKEEPRNPMTRRLIPYDVKVQIINRAPHLPDHELESLESTPEYNSRIHQMLSSYSSYLARINNMIERGQSSIFHQNGI